MPEDGFRVADYSGGDITVLPDLGPVHHDLDQPRVLREHVVGTVTQSEVDGCSDENYRVRLDQAISPAQAAQVRVTGGEASTTHRVQEDGGVDQLRELGKLFGCLRPPNIRTCKDHRALSVHNDVSNLANILGITIGSGLGPIFLRKVNGFLFRFAANHVYGHL